MKWWKIPQTLIIVNGNQLIITPNASSKESGVLTLKKSAGTGTPVAYKKVGQQTLMAGAIDKPNTYTVKIDVETEGSLKIKKLIKNQVLLYQERFSI